VSKRERRGRSFSVGTKLAVATVLVLSASSSIPFTQLTQRERRRLVDAKAVAGTMVTDLFAASCAAPLVFSDNDAINSELDKLRRNKAIVYAAVYSSKEDKTVGQTNPEQLAPFDFQHGILVSQRIERPDRIEVIKDIRNTHGEVIGFTVLDFSLAEENAAYLVNRLRLLWFSLLNAAGTAALLIMLARRLIVKPLSRVTEAARQLEMGDLHARANVRSNDEVGNLAMVFNRMGDAIVDRENKVVQAQKNVQDLFDNMLQAIFTVGPDGRINNEVSAFAKQIFGDFPIAGQPVTEFLRLDSMVPTEALNRMKLWLIHIFGSDDLQWDLCEPDRIHQLKYIRTNPDNSTDERSLELDYAPIYKNGAIIKIMFLVKDVTEVRRLQAEIARRDQQNEANYAHIRQIASIEPDIFNSFISEAYTVLDDCEQSLVELDNPERRLAAVNALFRGMHTLKGNARMFKLTAVQDIAHAAEDYFQKVRDGQIGLDGDTGFAMHERIVQFRKLLGEFEKLGRQVLGGEQETPGEAALSFLLEQEHVFDDWRVDIAGLGDEAGQQERERLSIRATKLRSEAQRHGFVNVVAVCDSLLRVLANASLRAEELLSRIQQAEEVLRTMRSLATEVAAAALWPYFLDEANTLLRALAAKIAAPIYGDKSLAGSKTTAVMLFAAAAQSFSLPTLAKVAADQYQAMIHEGLDARAVLNALDAWLADARNLVEMKSRSEIDVDLLGRFSDDAKVFVDRFENATPDQLPGLVEAAIACARRYRFRILQDKLESSAKTYSTDGRHIGEVLRQELDAYQAIRREIRDNRAAKALVLDVPLASGKSEQDLETWLASVSCAGLGCLAQHTRSLPTLTRMCLIEDVRHFEIHIPATRGAKAGHSVHRVLKKHIVALHESLRTLRHAMAHMGGNYELLIPSLMDLEKAVVHLTTLSLGDVLAPVASNAFDLARDRGKLLEEVAFDNLDLFLDGKLMQKIRNAVMHAIRNAIDHGLESSEARINAGKPLRGRIVVSARKHDGWINLAVEDDGRGVDTARVKEVALAHGLISAEQMTADELYELLFLPGFSTAPSVSMVSGRGVGMDAIRAIARELGGEVKLSSTPGSGSRLTMHFPAQLSKAKPSKDEGISAIDE
jgi:chemotaxis protein histidine kinase CheA/HAMP domain-containing protein